VIATARAKARAYLYGAHATHYQPAGHDPVLFLSPSSKYGKGKAIRGGVPICFPWFGPNTDDPSAPQHGPARTTHWALTQTHEDDGDVSLRFEADFEPFAARHQITFGQTLSMALSITNTSDAPAHFEAAQHTYLSVKDARNIRIDGLAGTDYFDKTDHGQRKTENQPSIQLTGETDRLYVDTVSACVLTDPGLGRSITVKKSGSNSTVIWNPWAEKAKAMGDLGDDDWPQMVCIESANAGPNKVTLEPGAEHVMRTTIETAHL
jgi:glucose-6-phosphate 1-epimerase